MNCDLGPWTCVLKDDRAIKSAWANYFAKYIDAYKAHGIDIWGITIQNEPEAMTGNIVYEGMHFTPETEKSFLRDYLGPVMKSRHSDVNILIMTIIRIIVTWANTILGDPETSMVGPHFTGTLAPTSRTWLPSIPNFLTTNCCLQSRR